MGTQRRQAQLNGLLTHLIHTRGATTLQSSQPRTFPALRRHKRSTSSKLTKDSLSARANPPASAHQHDPGNSAFRGIIYISTEEPNNRRFLPRSPRQQLPAQRMHPHPRPRDTPRLSVNELPELIASTVNRAYCEASTTHPSVHWDSPPPTPTEIVYYTPSIHINIQMYVDS